MKKVLKTFGLIILITFAFSILTEIVSAYQIEQNFKPDNQPFGLDYNENSGGNALGEGASDEGAPGSFATILILQIMAGTLLYFAAPVAVIMLAAAGWQMTTGGAETEKLEQAKKNITWTIVGLLAIIFSYSIVKFAITFVIKAADVEALPATEETGGTSFHHPTTPLIAEIEHLLS